ncbi:MAG: EF-P lysine aminoacylase GenX [Gammaproteobacteria bacterium]|jgi:lysyl-tRNA synthetase class 2|nr:EF-P lysine aminoacylase GenX [Gammaproteobacteria bacterium]MBT3725645.1 EF-P lysine aminoacylase GenX [Gammaproteobacteria bacterium]MBT4078382.1 EF-P lysine aminoacylase GenX [Gammaproteobacteria bacterium]MBT4195672.1 EF-P lysine aminoacylase GenX [Gammaproteobacteria bacterium]MBT4449188.1 EF-P lysine aminoacylase GenX [Gammaproteobacteria bacterium]
MQLLVENLKNRALIYQKIRAFFNVQQYLEVDTPLLGKTTNTDIHIQSIQAIASRRSVFLQTSPEFSMKRLLASGSGSIYQICHAFRDEEQGRHHHPEFTLLEWYSLGFDYQALINQLEELIVGLLEVKESFQRFSYFECFQQKLQLDLNSATLDDCRQKVSEHISGIDILQLNRDDCLDLLISEVVSKQFNGFTFVYDYPSSQASLAKIKVSNPDIAERFELFYNDLELANGFSELTDANEQRRRFEQDNVRRVANGLEAYPVDEDFLQALEQGLPECAGVALGLDRLLMVMSNDDNLQSVLTLDTFT